MAPLTLRVGGCGQSGGTGSHDEHISMGNPHLNLRDTCTYRAVFFGAAAPSSNRVARISISAGMKGIARHAEPKKKAAGGGEPSVWENY